MEATTAFIGPGSPWEDAFRKGFNAHFRIALLVAEIFRTLRDAQILMGNGRGVAIQSGPAGPLVAARCSGRQSASSKGPQSALDVSARFGARSFLPVMRPRTLSEIRGVAAWGSGTASRYLHLPRLLST